MINSNDNEPEVLRPGGRPVRQGDGSGPIVRVRRVASRVLLATGVLIGGMAAAACGNTTSTTPSTAPRQPGTSAAGHTAAYDWLSTTAEPWNHRLNRDQVAIDTASGRATGVSADTYFRRLETACATMFADASKAQAITRAPSSALDGTWRDMTAQSRSYASDCLHLAHSHSTADFTTWNSSLKTMNTANASFNAAVASVRAASTGAPG